MTELLVQIIGLAGVAVFILSYQIKSNKALYFMQLLGSGLFCVQFIMLDAISGCLSLMALIARNALLMKYNDWKWVQHPVWIGVFEIIYLIILALTWNGWLSLLPWAAMAFGTFGYWTNNAQKIRFANLVCVAPCWLLYDALVGSWAGVLNEGITLASILVSIYRYGWKAMGDPDSDFQK